MSAGFHMIVMAVVFAAIIAVGAVVLARRRHGGKQNDRWW
jgi:hypothetical protein